MEGRRKNLDLANRGRGTGLFSIVTRYYTTRGKRDLGTESFLEASNPR